MPVLPCVLTAAAFGVYLGAAFTYPFAHTAREMVDLWPKKNGIDQFDGNYRKASTYIWFHQNILGFYPGFFKNYFWHIAPQYCYFDLGGFSLFFWLRSWASSSTGALIFSMELLITLQKTVTFDLLLIPIHLSLPTYYS